MEDASIHLLKINREQRSLFSESYTSQSESKLGRRVEQNDNKVLDLMTLFVVCFVLHTMYTQIMSYQGVIMS